MVGRWVGDRTGGELLAVVEGASKEEGISKDRGGGVEVASWELGAGSCGI